MTKVVHIVGARPQFVKAAPVSRALKALGLDEVLVHTGQHYDWAMSEAFFEGLNLSSPALNLGIGSATHGAQTGRMLETLERVMSDESPDVVLVHGDTNSTLAGALAAAKMHIPVAHVEAGLRSFNRRMPEEVNRVLTDHMSTVLFAPTDNAVVNLAAEGISRGVMRTGDVMFDLFLQMDEPIKAAGDRVLRRWDLAAGAFALVTVHRPENTDDPGRWQVILAGLRRMAAAGLAVVWPVHPRVRDAVDRSDTEGLTTIEPLPYLETQILLRAARVVVTDSGGLQKEAAFHRTPCVTIREQTEWTELVAAGVNVVTVPDNDEFADLALKARWPDSGLPDQLYGDGRTAETIARRLAEFP